MDPNEPRLPALEDGRSPADLTKKELVAHLVAAEAIPQWKLNVMTRKTIVALFALPRDEALAAVRRLSDLGDSGHPQQRASRSSDAEAATGV